MNGEALAALGVITLIVTLFWLAASRAGRAAQKALTEEQNVDAAERIADARATAPTDPQQLADRLRHGGHL